MDFANTVFFHHTKINKTKTVLVLHVTNSFYGLNFGHNASRSAHHVSSGSECCVFLLQFPDLTAFLSDFLPWFMWSFVSSGELQTTLKDALVQVARTIPTSQAPVWLNWIVVRTLYTLPMNYLCQAMTWWVECIRFLILVIDHLWIFSHFNLLTVLHCSKGYMIYSPASGWIVWCVEGKFSIFLQYLQQNRWSSVWRSFSQWPSNRHHCLSTCSQRSGRSSSN